jgi:hypothetical protein
MAALIAAVDEANEFISSIFLPEKVCVKIAGGWVMGSTKNAITELWGEQVAQALYDRRGVISKENFPFVYWEGMELVIKLFWEMFHIWVTKHVSHFQGTNQQLSRLDKLVLNVCPSCKCHDESTSHITWCRNPGWTRILKDLVEQLVQWLYDQQMDGEVVQLFKQYLLAGGTCTLTLLLKPNSRLGVEARFHDCLGWDCFLEGQLCALWVEHRAQHIQLANRMQSTDFWVQGLMQQLLQMTQTQWAYRNATVHLEVKEG